MEVEGGTLTAVAGFDGHQGVALVVEPRTFAGLDDVLARAVERGEPPFVLVLDSLEDPQNVGTLLRSAEAAGVHGVLFPTHRQAPLSPAAIKASAGAVEHLLLCPVDDLPGALSDLRIRGLRVAAAEADAPLTTAQADLRGPLAIIVGSEGQGLSPVVRRRADVAVRIPMRGAIGSLNAAVAGSILLFAAVAQRDPAGEGSDARPRPPTFDEIVDEASGGAAQADHEAESTPAGHAVTSDASVSPSPSPSPAPARKRTRPPAPTTAAQKRSRAAKAATDPEGPEAPRGESPGDESPSTDPEAPAPGPRRRKPSAAQESEPAAPPPAPAPRRRRKAAAAGSASGTEAPPTPAAPPKRATRRATSDAPPTAPAEVAPPANGEEAADREPDADDLLPGGPPGLPPGE